MAKGINKCILVGNLGKEPEVRAMASGKAVTNITIATSESWTDKQSGQKQERTEWHRVVFFDRLAEIAGQYLKKGSKVYVEGSLKTRKWQDQSGKDCYTTEIVASEMQMLDSRTSESGHQSSDADREFYTPQPEPTQRPQQSCGGGWSDPQGTGAPEGMMSHGDNDPFNIPF